MDLTVSERFKVRCSPQSYQVRWVKSKGAVLVLLWNCFIVNSYGAFSQTITGILGLYTTNEALIQVINDVIQGASLVLLYPFAGWLADVYFGRYKVIHGSLHLMWTGIVVITACLCLTAGVGFAPVKYIVIPVHIVSLLVVQFGIAGFKANAIPFGIDQLTEGSSSELSAFIHWYFYTIFFNIRALSIPFSCFVDGPSALVLQVFIQAISATLALCLDLCLSTWLILEPGTRNPFKLIYQVLSYAWRNKHPRFRSAFTYHVQEIPSRLELCKPQYGGPFTVEQVEDVKTFLRMLVIIIPMSAIFMLGVSARIPIDTIGIHMPSNMNCVTKNVLGTDFALLLILILQPPYELLLFPLVHNVIPTMLVRVGIGTVLVIASLLAQLSIDIIGHIHIKDNSATSPNNASHTLESTCFLNSDSVDMDVSYAWVSLPGTLLAFGSFLLFIPVCEFVFAQVPYSMKGFFIGLVYGIQGVFKLIVLAFHLPLYLGAADTSASFPTCGFFYYFINITITTVALVWYSCAAWKYKKREREPTESHQAFVEEFYTKYLQSESNSMDPDELDSWH